MSVPAGKGAARSSLVNYDSGKGLLRLCLMQSGGLTPFSCSEDPPPSLSLNATTAGGNAIAVRVLGSTDRASNAYTLKVEYP